MIRASKHIIIVFYVSRYSLEIFDKSRSTETTSERIIWVSSNEIKSDSHFSMLSRIMGSSWGRDYRQH